MASGLIGNEVPLTGLRVRLPCPPLLSFWEFTQDTDSCRLLSSCALFSSACCILVLVGLAAPCSPNLPSTAVYNDAFNDALFGEIGAVDSGVKRSLGGKKGTR